MSSQAELLLQCERRAAKQHGVLTYEQAKRCGLSTQAVARKIRSRQWQRIHRTVVSPFSTPLTWEGEQMAACLHGGFGCVAAGAAAARLWRLPTFEKAGVEIFCNKNVRLSGVTVHRSLEPLKQPRVSVSRIPIEGCESMLVRIAARRSVEVAGAVFDECWRRHMTDTQRLQYFLDGEGQGMRGAKAMRRVLKERLEWSEVTDSEMETLFLRLARRYRLVPDRSHVVIRDQGVHVKEVDFVYSDARLAIELDSFKHHGDIDPFDKDREVDVVLRRLGWRVLRFTWRHLTKKPDWVFSEIRHAIGVVPLPKLG